MPDSAEPTWYWVVCWECCVMLELEWLSWWTVVVTIVKYTFTIDRHWE